ncbi:hypothetical protein CFAM422_012531 [Trichoderma lentiforme]|uniref:Uncharacterized protein n=1 Tax=Trichoderma lentiforme TaxID=1567552 RepID=A0A9P5C8K4_9HYPO|nr:hypothetical protein CFAM422_012531 [Trichoderma lentiforme]
MRNSPESKFGVHQSVVAIPIGSHPVPAQALPALGDLDQSTPANQTAQVPPGQGFEVYNMVSTRPFRVF